jgi:hypothetical protein
VTNHTNRGVRPSLYVDDGFGNLSRIDFGQLVTRMVTGWREL